MATDVTGSALRGFGLPYILTPSHIWDAKATFTQQGPTPGEPTPQGSYTLALESSGAQSASKELRVKVQQGGVVQPGGAEIIYQYDGDTNWRGCDVQQTSAWQVVRTTAAAATSALSDPDACAFYDTDRTDKIAVVYQRTAAGPTAYNVQCSVYDPSDGTWSSVVVYTNTTSPTDGYHPTITYNKRDGYLYVAHWIYDGGADLAQVRVHRSQDGVTWETVSSYALEEGLDISSSPGSGNAGYEAGRLRMAFSGGQCLLVAHVIANDNAAGSQPRDQLAQWFSVSRAARFSLVEIAQLDFGGGVTNVFAFQSVMEIDGKLTVAWPSTIAAAPTGTYMYLLALPSASSSISGRATTAFESSVGVFTFEESGSANAGRVFDYDNSTNYQVTDGDGTVWVDEDGTVQGAWRLATTAATNDQGVFLARSTDGGQNWKYTGNGDADGTDAAGALVFYTGDASTYLSDFVGVSHRGRQVLIGLNTTDVTTEVTLSALFLGGPSTVTLPSPIAYPRPYQRSSWTQSYLPFELPANISALTTTGAGTDSITTAGLLNRATSANTKYSTFTLTSTVAQGIVARFALTVNSGGTLTGNQIALNLRSADGGTHYDVYIRFTTAGFRMWDDLAGAQIGVDKTAVAPSGGIEVLAAIAGGEFSCWFRAISSESDRDWTAALQGQSLTAGGGSTDVVRFGTIATGTADYDIHEVHAMAGANVNGKLGGGFTNPDDLHGRTLSRRGQFIGIDDGVRLVAVDGSAMEGDTFHIDTAYEHPIERILHRESPTPRSQWRSVAVTSGNTPEQLIPFVLNPDATTLGGEEQGFGSTLLYATFSGVNWSAGSIERWDTGTAAWVSVVTLTNAITTSFSMTREGNTLRVPSLPTTTSGRYFRENECAGWTVKLGSDYRKITGNTAGTLATNISSPKPVFFLDGIDDSESTSTTITLIPDQFSVTFHTDGEIGGGWAVRIDAQETADLDLRCGHFSMGRVFVFGTQYGRGRVAMYESGDLTQDSISGVRRARRAGPGGRTVRIAWPDPIDTTQLQGTTTAPDYLTSTATAGNWPVAAAKDPPLSIRGVLEQVGARDAITYLPCIALTADTIHYRFSDSFMLCTIASAVQVESVLGEECDPDTGELFRVATVVLEEVR